MRKLFVAALLSFAVMSCAKQTSKATIEGTITDMQSGNIVLKVLDVNTQVEVDTIIVKSGGKELAAELERKGYGTLRAN